ncbi:MerC domain-containing protein [Erythrobacter sp. YT30]|uniref:MerC domain-containing protein n=1 Tax=Erythrobacter sp. YT30 TaxID=1735012 RepID=UPI00076C3CF3|nr:MerC domain-containing protein [Erythrobacter sp. YT30]KWV92616.1 hypothetical protein AUC45_00040 [Erythrobacter sp. YT30]
MRQSVKSDRAAVLLSFACVLHCLALPLLAFALPIAGTIAEIEAVHWALGIAAIAISMSVPVRYSSARVTSFLLPAGLGSAFIASAFFAEGFGIDETLPTLIGASLMGFAHLRRVYA